MAKLEQVWHLVLCFVSIKKERKLGHVLGVWLDLGRLSNSDEDKKRSSVQVMKGSVAHQLSMILMED